MAEYDYSTRPYDDRINVWRRLTSNHPWELIAVVEEQTDAWAVIAAERKRPVIKEAA